MHGVRCLSRRRSAHLWLSITHHHTACALTHAQRGRLTNASVLSDVRGMIKTITHTEAGNNDPNRMQFSPSQRDQSRCDAPATISNDDFTNKKVYYAKRQADAIAYALREKERHRTTTQSTQQQPHTVNEQQQQQLRYVRSVDAFGDKSIQLRHNFSGLADNRIITWYENVYWNYVRYFLTQEMLIAKDRWGNKFTVTWQHTRSREEQRRAYRCDRDKQHLPYGSLATDDRLWERWMRGHRGDPPSIAEEEHFRQYKKSYLGAYVVGEEEVEQAMMRVMAHMHRAADTFKELDPMEEYGDAHRRVRPMREREANPGAEMATRRGWGKNNNHNKQSKSRSSDAAQERRTAQAKWNVEDEMNLDAVQRRKQAEGGFVSRVKANNEAGGRRSDDAHKEEYVPPTGPCAKDGSPSSSSSRAAVSDSMNRVRRGGGYDETKQTADNSTEEEDDTRSMEKRRRDGATWTIGFARGDLFYNEEEVEVMRGELGHMYRNMEWQNLEYKRQVRVHRRQHPLSKPAEGTTSPNEADGPAPRHVWERTDLGIPYHDAVPDLTTPMLERLRTESDQLEEERLGLRKELGLTDLGDIREGRDPIVCDTATATRCAPLPGIVDERGNGNVSLPTTTAATTSPAPFQPPPVSTRWKPRCWEEAWGTGGGVPY